MALFKFSISGGPLRGCGCDYRRKLIIHEEQFHVRIIFSMVCEVWNYDIQWKINYCLNYFRERITAGKE